MAQSLPLPLPPQFAVVALRAIENAVWQQLQVVLSASTQPLVILVFCRRWHLKHCCKTC